MPSAVVIKHASGPDARTSAKVVDLVTPTLAENQALVQVDAVSLNHRDLWLLRGVSYHAIRDGSIIGSDGVGRIARLSTPSNRLKVNDRVVVMPSIGWNDDPRGPEDETQYFLLDDAKIEKAIQLGAKGGANYKKENWEEDLLKATKGALIDVVIDGASGANAPIILSKVLHQGGFFVNYGTTAGTLEWSMSAVGRNVELKASTMGSRKEFEAMLEFVDKTKIRPIVSDVFKGLHKAHSAFEHLETGSQFGKVVITVKEN
ncbi:hypothetical protein BGW38_008757 [Lunasporangiospora selenospora]|uniref:Enoyl reductase (ER) domain-containing protein n=1 Tax=Lunasporangiospora selenospora TaxID=979761 RepID=A0A9P6FY20_9FUNG|nr:hypothetical protein BGW38_008757 [Lunasporangiospora selenospora]